jgi:tetratricopeptide (TPR) repeat protein
MTLFAFTPITTGAAPDEPNSRFNKDLLVQNAMSRAQLLLIQKDAQKAVEILEEQLPNVNGNPKYLLQLRDAYRSYVMDLSLRGQPELAKRYFDRLCILDPSAANDATFRPQVETAPRKFEVEPIKQSVLQFPIFKNPFAKKEEPTSPPIIKPSVVRAHSDDSAAIDPFAQKYQRETAPVPSVMRAQPVEPRELLLKGEAEFKRERYAEARMYFEQAVQADQASLEACRMQLAFCIIKGVSESMEQPGVLPAKLPELKKQVESAIGMAPTQLLATGQTLLVRLEERAKVPNVLVKATTVSHRGQNKEGWHVAETRHFRIFHRLDTQQAEQIAQIAENTRTTMYRKWFEVDGADWDQHCQVIVHPNVASYTQMTGVPANSPGHSRIESDPASGRIVERRVDVRLDIATMADAVLPHETTHVVIAGMFGNAPVPRWADEGIAVLSEPNEKIDLHRRNLGKHHKDGLLFGLKELMELKDYPHPRQIGSFYAQSVVLVEFLVQKRGPKTFSEFVKDGVRQGYDAALQRHYSMTFTQLDQAWQQQVINNPERVAAQK